MNKLTMIVVTTGLLAMATMASATPPKKIEAGAKLDNVVIVIKADKTKIATITRDFVLPQGRSSEQPDGGTRYVGRLEAIKVEAPDGMTFKMTPTITVTTSANGTQTMNLQMAYGDRSGARNAQTEFEATMTIGGGESRTLNYTGTQGCLHGDTLITLYDGTRVPIDDVMAGEYVLNPITGAPQEVLVVIRGPEPFPLIEVGFGKRSVLFTEQHPIPTPDGIKQAADVRPGDRIQDENGRWRRVTTVLIHPVRKGQVVYNLLLASDTDDPIDHMFLAGGLVVGDNWLQERPSE